MGKISVVVRLFIKSLTEDEGSALSGWRESDASTINVDSIESFFNGTNGALVIGDGEDDGKTFFSDDDT